MIKPSYRVGTYRIIISKNQFYFTYLSTNVKNVKSSQKYNTNRIISHLELQRIIKLL